MGRKIALEIRKYFIYDEHKKGHVCAVQNCSQFLNGDNVTNLRRHLERRHSEIILKMLSSNNNETESGKISKHDLKKVRVLHSESLMWEGCLELVSVGGLPFSFIEQNGFKKIIKPIADGLGCDKSFNTANLKQKIKEFSTEIRNKIKKDIRGKTISLKIDAATRRSLSVLGINAQFVKNGKIKVYTLAVKELKRRHTAEYIKDLILETLREYEICPSQIYTITSDNGRNMIKATNILQAETEIAIDELLRDDSANESIGVNLSNVEEILCTNTSFTMVNCIRCAAHTLQLVAFDVLKEPTMAKNVAVCHKLAVSLRKSVNISKIKEKRLNLPILNIVTRWNSTYDMIARLLDLKDFCMEICEVDADLDVNNSIWEFMAEFLVLFKPLKISTLQLQDEQMGLGDFYKTWLRLTIELNKISIQNVSLIKKSMDMRQKLLLENDIMLTALYLDPRFNFILTTEQKEIAKGYILKMHRVLQSVEPSKDDEDVVSNRLLEQSSSFETISNLSAGEDELNDYLNNLAASRNSEQADIDTLSIHQELLRYQPQRMVDSNINVFTYWSIKSSEYLLLSKIALIIHAVPATQVTVERAFSALAFILTDRRNRLSSERVQELLLVRLNYEFEK